MNPQTVESPVKPAEQIQFDFLPQIPVVVQPSAGPLTSDAGLLPIRQFDQRWNYTQRMAACLLDPKPRRDQSLLSMLRQRLFGILAGYEDCNDHDTLRDDPMFKLIAERLPDGEALASQPTLSRFENLASPQVLQKLIDFNIATGLERLKQHYGGHLPATLTLDLDATDDPTHGQQQLTFFHGYFEQYQYFPLIISEPATNMSSSPGCAPHGACLAGRRRRPDARGPRPAEGASRHRHPCPGRCRLRAAPHV